MPSHTAERRVFSAVGCAHAQHTSTNTTSTMQTSNTTVIEINGVKLEVDLRTARRVENIRVGTRVKVLQKKYSDTYEIRHGVVIGFEPFLELPTIIIAVAKIEYNSATVEFVYFNSKSEGIQIVVSCDDDLAALDKNDFIKQCERETLKLEAQIADIQAKKRYFLDKFACYWQPVEAAVKDATDGIPEFTK